MAATLVARAQRDGRRSGSLRRDDHLRQEVGVARQGSDTIDRARSGAPAAVGLSIPSITSVPLAIDDHTGIENSSWETVHALFAHGIVPLLEHRTDEPLNAYLTRVCAAFNDRWSRLPFDVHISTVEVEERATVLAQFFVQDTAIKMVEAAPFDRHVAKYNRSLARRIFTDIGEACGFGLAIYTPARLIELGNDHWYYTDTVEWYANVMDEAITVFNQRATIHDEGANRPSDHRILANYIRDEYLMSPGVMRRAIGRHHACAPRISSDERDRLIDHAPAHIRRELIAIREACGRYHGDRSLRWSYVSGDEENEGWADMPAIIFDTATTQPERARPNLVGELLRDFEQSMLEQGVSSYLPSLSIELAPRRSSMMYFQQVLVRLEHTMTTIEEVVNVIEGFTATHEVP